MDWSKASISVLMLMAFSTGFISAQTPADCPRFDVSGPAGIVLPGNPVRYVLSLDEAARKLPLKIVWTVSRGEIKSGQGTTVMELLQPDAQLTVAATIEGLPAGCPDSASETAIADPPPQTTVLARVAGALTKAKVEEVRQLIKMRNDPYAAYYFIVSAEKGRAKSIDQKIAKLKSGLKEQSYRAVFVSSDKDDDLVKVYYVPPGAERPVN